MHNVSSQIRYLSSAVAPPTTHIYGNNMNIQNAINNKQLLQQRNRDTVFPSQYPTQECRGGMNKANEIKEEDNDDKFDRGGVVTERMELMAALAMTQLGGGDRVLKTPSTLEKKEMTPRRVSSSDSVSEIKLSTQGTESLNESKESFNNKRMPPFVDKNDNLNALKKLKPSTKNQEGISRFKNQENIYARDDLRNNRMLHPKYQSSVPTFNTGTKVNTVLQPLSHQPNGRKYLDLDTCRAIGKLPNPLSYRKICSSCGKTRSEHSELGFGNKCVFLDCGRCGAGIQIHHRVGKPMGFLCTLTPDEGACLGAAEKYDKKIRDLAFLADLKKEVSSIKGKVA